MEIVAKQDSEPFVAPVNEAELFTMMRFPVVFGHFGVNTAAVPYVQAPDPAGATKPSSASEFRDGCDRKAKRPQRGGNEAAILGCRCGAGTHALPPGHHLGRRRLTG